MPGPVSLLNALEAVKVDTSPEVILLYFKIARSFWAEREEPPLERGSVIEMIDEEIIKYRAIIEERTPCRLCKYFIGFTCFNKKPGIKCSELGRLNREIVISVGCRYKKLEPNLHEEIICQGVKSADRSLCDSAKGDK